jgi:hypothetical protein
MGLSGARWPQEDDVLLRCNEIQRPQVRDRLPVRGALVVEVELLQRLACREPGGADPLLTSGGVTGGHLPLQACGQELFVVQFSARARSASRSTEASRLGAFIARVR